MKPHTTQAWLHSKDPEFKEKTNEIVDLYTNPPEGCAVICGVDEKPIQATEHKHDRKPAVPGKAAKVEYEYIRHGTQALIAGFDIGNGHVTAQCGDTRKSTDLINFMEGISAAYTGYDKIHIVWDNLNIHHVLTKGGQHSIRVMKINLYSIIPHCMHHGSIRWRYSSP